MEKLLLREEEVPLGALVKAFCLAGNPDEKNEQTFLVLAVRGENFGRKFFPVISMTGDGENPGSITLGECMHGFAQDMRFSPLKAFIKSDAPKKTRFAVFMNGRRALTLGGMDLVVTTDEERRFMSAVDGDHTNYSVLLSPEATLVPIFKSRQPS